MSFNWTKRIGNFEVFRKCHLNCNKLLDQFSRRLCHRILVNKTEILPGLSFLAQTRNYPKVSTSNEVVKKQQTEK